MRIHALILAGGSGSRFGSALPKQFLPEGEKPILAYSIEKLQSCPGIDGIYVVCSPEYFGRTRAIVREYCLPMVRVLPIAGVHRAVSSYNGITVTADVADSSGAVLIHDAARPLVSMAAIEGCVEAARRGVAAVVAEPCNDTLFRVNEKGFHKGDFLPRDGAFMMQTPQVFPIADIFEAYESAADAGGDWYEAFTDDSGVYLKRFPEREVAVVVNKGTNLKITTAEDLSLFSRLKGLHSIG